MQRAFDTLDTMVLRGQLDPACVQALQNGVVDVMSIMSRFAE
ncbi:MAG: hypothetical protein U5L74_07310 [Ideonella sp.]|nr:hypothetical protein [Ideonella sp.]